jgi:hypothetical protein
LAHVLTSKYLNHLPLYRQEQMYAREGIELSRKTMCGWVRECAKLLRAVYEWMKKDVLCSHVMHTDDTPILVQGKRKTSTPRHQGRLWVYVGDETHEHVVFDFTPTRSRDGPERFLKGYRGYLQADAFAGYDRLYATGEVIEVACWAHCRRRFFEAKGTDALRSVEALARIKKLYGIERDAKEYEEAHGLVGQARALYRQRRREEEAQPLLDALETWLLSERDLVLPKSPMGEAISYALGQWQALCRYVSDGHLEIDNNKAEREIRPVAIGRKNYLFVGSDGGGQSAAIIYSLLATCNRHGINPFIYLRDVLQRIADHPINRIEELTPQGWRQSQEPMESSLAQAAAS